MKVRTEKILHKLLFSNQVITIHDVAKQYNVGLRTIQGDISEINEVLARYSLPLVKNTRREGLLLELSDEGIELVCDLLKNNNYEIYFEKDVRQFHLILELTVGSSFFIYEKETEFGISKSALDSDMRDIRRLMKNYDLMLKSDLKNGLKLLGSERNIRTMLFDQIFKTLSVEDIFVNTNHVLSEYRMFFEFIPLDMLKKLNDIYAEFYKYSNYLYKDQLLIILSIWILRNNKLMNSECKTTTKVNHEIIKPFIKKINQKFNLNPNEDEIEYINSIMDTLTEDVDINPSDWLEIQLFTINLIHELNTMLNISFENQPDNVFKKLFEHNIRLHARLKKNIQLYNPLTKDINLNNSYL